VGRVPGGRRQRLTILGAIARDGLVAVTTVAAATSTAVFLAFIERVLVPALRARPEVLVAQAAGGCPKYHRGPRRRPAGRPPQHHARRHPRLVPPLRISCNLNRNPL
jgi:hypothetical protein